MARQYNCYIILVTATMPMLLDTIDLIEDKEKYFRKLNRIEIINNSESEITLDEFEDIVLEDILENKDKSFLIVLNTVKSSKNIYKYLKENTDRDIIYLSTEIYPKLRLEKINKIKKHPSLSTLAGYEVASLFNLSTTVSIAPLLKNSGSS